MLGEEPSSAVIASGSSDNDSGGSSVDMRFSDIGTRGHSGGMAIALLCSAPV